jgi:simple sugar transport system substrate-binding protein
MEAKMERKMYKSWILITLLIVVSMLLAQCAPTTPPPQQPTEKKFKVGLLHPSPITDAWSGIAYQALKRIEAELGAEIANVEIKSPAEREKGFIDFASQGYDLVIGHDFAMQDAAEKVSKDFPNTFFTTTGGSKFTDNYAPIDLIPGYKQALYAVGVMAGNITKTKKAVAFTMELPATKIPLEGFQAGFNSIPGNSCSMVILKDGNDVGAAKEAALQAIADGADILIANANIAGTGVLQAVAENEGKVWGIGTIGDQTNLAPKGVLVSATLNVSEALFSIAKAVKEGTMKGGRVRVFTVNDPGVYDFVYNPETADLVTDEMKALLEDTLNKIKSGEIKVE